MKKYGCINIHPSMLPKYRGAAPIQRAIINGEKETAVCIIQMDQEVDTGDIILCQKFHLAKIFVSVNCMINALKLELSCSKSNKLYSYITTYSAITR
ncbi:formyl transferase family protein [Orientia tsutsugamushi str. Sido]|nr:formyl transferase family protein [Orientia tsutsugamushi str. Sido]